MWIGAEPAGRRPAGSRAARRRSPLFPAARRPIGHVGGTHGALPLFGGRVAPTVGHRCHEVAGGRQNSARRPCRKCPFICGRPVGTLPEQSSVISAGAQIAMSGLRRIRGDDGPPDAGCVSGCVRRGGLSGRAGASRAAPDGSQPGSAANRSSGYERYPRCTPPGSCPPPFQRCRRRQCSAGPRLPLVGLRQAPGRAHRRAVGVAASAGSCFDASDHGLVSFRRGLLHEPVQRPVRAGSSARAPQGQALACRARDGGSSGLAGALSGSRERRRRMRPATG